MEFTNSLAYSTQLGAAGLIARCNSLYSIGISAVTDRPPLVLFVRENGAFVSQNRSDTAFFLPLTEIRLPAFLPIRVPLAPGTLPYSAGRTAGKPGRNRVT